MKFEFNEKTHSYTLDGKPLTGVTTILGTIAKPALIQWAANEAVKYVKENLTDINDLDKVLLEAKKAHTSKRDKSADVGSLAHNWIEKWIRGEKQAITDDIKPMIDNFLQWSKGVNFLESELRVYSEKYWYAGTLDFIAEIDGEKWLGDFKTSSGIYPEMFYQTAAYQNALQEMGLHQDIKGHIIVNLTKDGRLNVQKSTEYEENRKAFMGALAIYRRQGQLKNG
jgi:hypothetical protein